MKLAIGNDHIGLSLKRHIAGYLEEKGHTVQDYGTYDENRCDYPVFAKRVANAVRGAQADLGILICGTGVGISVAANKMHGIRAVVCSEPYSASLSRQHNNANIVAFGANVVDVRRAEEIVDAFLSAAYEGGRHQRRVDMMREIEKEECLLCAKNPVPKPLIAYQVYSAREEAEKDLSGTLKEIRRIGFDGVEFAGFYGHSADQVKEMLDETGLIAVSSHVPMAAIEKDMFGVISYHLAIGCGTIAIPYLDEANRPGAAGFARTLSTIQTFGRLCRKAGIRLLYHNHDFEFIRLSDQYGLDFLYDAVPSEVLQTEIDTCWVKYAGLDPAEYIRKYTGRCPVVHLKDYVGTKGDASPYALIGIDEHVKQPDTAFEFRPVGYGCQDFPQILKAGLEAGATCFVVEQDQSLGRTPLEAAAMSRDYLRSLGY